MDKEVFVQNIKNYCALRGVKPTVACRESGAGPNLINQMLTRGSIPSVEKVQLLAQYLGVTTSELLGEEKGPAPVSESEPLYPPEYDRLSPEDKELIDNMIRRLILEKDQVEGSSPSNGAGSETA